MITFIKRQMRSFKNAFKGICIAYKIDTSIKAHYTFGLAFVTVFSYLVWPLTSTEFLFLLLSYFLVIITEMQNTALEEALDRLHPKKHTKIGHSKDVAAASVLVAGFFAFFVVASITLSRLA